MATGFPTTKIAGLYAGIPEAVTARLFEFRAKYPYQQLDFRGMKWPYIDTGEGEQVVLLMSGATCIAEISWQTIGRLAHHYRVIAPDYPPVESNADLSDGIVNILDKAGVHQAHLVGGSAGGLAAQSLIRRHPERFATMVLSHTLLPSQTGGSQLSNMLRWLRFLPQPVLRAFFKRTMNKLQPHDDAPQTQLFKAHFTEIANTRLTKAQIISLMRRTAELSLNTPFSPDDLRSWPGRILLIMAEDDPATPASVREALTAMYPQAQVRLFSGTGHTTAVLKQDEYIDAIVSFIEQ